MAPPDEVALNGDQPAGTYQVKNPDGSMSEVTLAQVAGIDMDAVEERRQFEFPGGHYGWKIVDGKVGELKNKSHPGGKCAGIEMEIECVRVHSFAEKDPGVDPNDVIGQKFFHRWFVTEVNAIGYYKSFLVDAGSAGKTQRKGAEEILKDLASIGFEFNGKITARPNKDNPDQIYRNLDVPGMYSAGSITPVSASVAA